MVEDRDPHDNYETPDEAVDMLMKHGNLKRGAVLEPSAGRGRIVRRLVMTHHRLVASYDLHAARSRFHPGIGTGVDFLNETTTRGCPHVIMNPPYSQADKHVRHALKIMPQKDGRVCVLLRLTWMAAMKRKDLLPHIDKIIICGRLKMLPPGVEDQGFNGAVDFAWFIFDPWKLPMGTQIVRA
jgi:adenine-specific DNA methylase